jgi:5-methylcytosine-specific restriction endonuclease McrA
MLKLTKPQRRAIYDSTGGYCHLCHGKVAWTSYGKHGNRGAWEVDHSVARANGGSDRMPNLRPACTSCNREKQDMTTRGYRARSDLTCAPPSREHRRSAAAWRSFLTFIAFVGVIVVAVVLRRSAASTMRNSP